MPYLPEVHSCLTDSPSPAYWLISYDKHGRERREEDRLLSEELANVLVHDNVTDVILLAHGWNNDLSDAQQQYCDWARLLMSQTMNKERLLKKRPSFKPVLIGMHWPSLAWGDEGMGAFPVMADSESMVDRYARQIADSPAARQALDLLLSAAEDDLSPEMLPEAVVAAYRVLFREAMLGTDMGMEPGLEETEFDPEMVYQQTNNVSEAYPATFGGGIAGGLLAPLRILSFWTMKKRALTIGETAAYPLLRRLRSAVAGRDVRFHGMGHSFGCIVMSAMIAGPLGSTREAGVIDTVFLVCGALSLWSYAQSIPPVPDERGRFHQLIADQMVKGLMLAVCSKHDTANRVFYPIAAGVAGQVAYLVEGHDLPKYGALGIFGAQGGGVPAVERVMGDAGAEYGFVSGGIYNLDGSAWIRHGSFPTGAHNDILHPEVAHAFWQAMEVGA
ncbi:MAG: hypothetical protein H7839_15500 [Magnetococcus sp. YQC-5]